MFTDLSGSVMDGHPIAGWENVPINERDLQDGGEAPQRKCTSLWDVEGILDEGEEDLVGERVLVTLDVCQRHLVVDLIRVGLALLPPTGHDWPNPVGFGVVWIEVVDGDVKKKWDF